MGLGLERSAERFDDEDDPLVVERMEAPHLAAETSGVERVGRATGLEELTGALGTGDEADARGRLPARAGDATGVVEPQRHVHDAALLVTRPSEVRRALVWPAVDGPVEQHGDRRRAHRMLVDVEPIRRHAGRFVTKSPVPQSPSCKPARTSRGSTLRMDDALQVAAVHGEVVPRVMLLFPSQSYRVEAFVEAARRRHIDLLLATDMPAAFGRLGLPVIGAHFDDPELAASDLARAARGMDIVALIPTNEATAVIGALVAERLGLPHNSAESVHRTRDKRQMRERLAACGVPSPAFRVVEPREQAGDFAPALRFPAVVKPAMLTGSQGVIRVDDEAQLARAVPRVRAIVEKQGGPTREGDGFYRLLVEDYLPGEEVTVEGLMTDGRLEALAIFDKPDPLTGPFFEETIYVTPSRLPPAQQRDVLDVTERAAKALGLTHGPIHAELRTTPERGAFIVEVAARSIGGLCSRVFEFIAGSLEELLLAHAIGAVRDSASSSAPGSYRAAGVMMIPIPRSGVLRGVLGLDEARAVPGIESVKLEVQLGEAIRALPEGNKYLGFIFARGESPEVVLIALRRGHAALQLELSPLLEIVSDGGLGLRGPA